MNLDRPAPPPCSLTAYSLANSMGSTTEEVIAALRSDRSGLLPCTLDVPFSTHAGMMNDVPALLPSLSEFDSRSARIALLAIEGIRPALDRARSRWGSSRVAVVMGTTTAGLVRTEQAYAVLKSTGRVPDDYDPEKQHAFGSLVEVVRRATNVTGPGIMVGAACAASGKAFGTAQRLIAMDLADAVLVGGVDALCQTTLRGFHALEILGAQRCQPFGLGRTGINLGEGGAYVLVERRGDARAMLLAVGESSDAYHMTSPHPEGAGAEAAIREAVLSAGLEPSAIDHVNAHSPGTRLNDYAESKAIRKVLGPNVPTVSTKGYTGHLLGAAGATEAIFALLTLEQGWIPSSLGADPVDPDLGITINTKRRDVKCRFVISNSFAFGGSNVSVLLGATA